MSRPLRIGLLGASRIAPPAVVLPARQGVDVVVTAVAARDPARALAFASMHGIPRVFDDYDALVRSSDVDAVYIGLPASLHCTWTLRALEEKKHVLCEKPLACNESEAKTMVRAAERVGCVLGEAFHYRYHPVFHELLAMRASGELGDLLDVEGRFEVGVEPGDIRYQLALGGGATMDLGCYPIHWLRTLVGDEPRVRSAHPTAETPGVDVAMEAELEFSESVTGRVRCSMERGTPFSARLVIRGTLGTLEVENPLAPHLGHRVRFVRPGREALDKQLDGRTTYDHQLEAFACAIRDGRALPTGGADSVANMRVIDSVYDAAGLGRRGAGLADFSV